MKVRNYLILFLCAAVITGSAVMFIDQTKPQKVNIHGLMPKFSEEDLILNADLIIEGYVAEISDGKWSNPEFADPQKRNIIQTDIHVTIADILSGDYDKNSVTVRIDKGYDEQSNTELISDGFPDFSVNEKVLLFLSRDDSDLATNEDYFVLTGMSQGKFNISSDKIKNKNHSDKKEYTKSALKSKIKEEKEKNPNWKEEKEKQKAEIKKKNIELFGE